ncbi:metalloprotease family protein [Halobacteria archaeon AArc-curdl1]|uniref:Metalloprotease family protein n=1 Tax=Natronosalvus hydrolyticus TaxID=2979988 RepID=A0AAP2Z7U5_9EURY|nr:metalloprotease family protein [Halobacteria archaeon AArc-curdl1]
MGYLSSLLTAPGVVVHEFAHKTVCDLTGVPVVDVSYFQFGDPAGYVRHQEPSTYRTSFLISVAPFFVNTILALVLFTGFWHLLGTLGPLEFERVLLEGVIDAPLEMQAGLVVLAWLGFVIGLQAFPSTGDANTLWTRTRGEWRSAPLVLVGLPFVFLIYLVNLLSWAYLHVFYAAALAVGAFVGVVTLV